MDKIKLIEEVCNHLHTQYETTLQAAKHTHAAATDEENVPDNKYDTLSLEASYLAQGQANRAADIKHSLYQYTQLLENAQAIRHSQDTISIPSLITLTADSGKQRLLLLGPSAGGTVIHYEGEEILIITPTSPLGEQLLEKSDGDMVSLGTEEWEVTGID